MSHHHTYYVTSSYILCHKHVSNGIQRVLLKKKKCLCPIALTQGLDKMLTFQNVRNRYPIVKSLESMQLIGYVSRSNLDTVCVV